ncbi:MAG: GNAT family N-acetyltransferase [Alphaproteobacteria bacterium]
MFKIAPETLEDLYEVEVLYDLAFAPGRNALSSYRLRDGVAQVDNLSLVARDDYGSVAGAIRYWPVSIGAQGHAALLLGPIAVHPTRQGEGIGNLLIRESLERAKADWSRVLLIGDLPYYSRFGFHRTLAQNLEFPPPTNPERLLAQELHKGAFEGVSGQIRKWDQAK